MASQQKELVEKLNKHKVEVSSLRSRLNELDKEKESWFRKKAESSVKIRYSIQKIKDNKSKRDSLTNEVKELKLKRDGVNNGIEEKLKELGKLRQEKAELAKSIGIKEHPSRIRQHIEKLEFRIETETVSFEKEKELMKKIKGLRKLYDDASVIDEADKKIENASNEIKKMRKKADELHKTVQDKARQSQILHEGILKTSAEIDKMKIDEEDAFRKFSELKWQFAGANSQLKEKLKEMGDAKSQLDKIHFEKKERRRLEQESFLKSKENAVNEKIKRGEKLTTEDLLVFQNTDKG